ncbi:MAG: hypothetical protein WAZ94_13395 [Phycisphaerales bacterium]
MGDGVETTAGATAAEAPQEPYLNAAAIGRALNRDKRAVLHWFAGDDPPPHVVLTRGKLSYKAAILTDVKAWLTRRGLDVVKLERAIPGRAARKGEGGAGNVGGAGEDTGDTSGAESSALFEAAVAEGVRRELAKFGAAEQGLMFLRTKRALEDLFKHPPAADADAGEKDRWSSAMQKCSRELRQMEEQMHSLQVRACRWVDLPAAKRVVSGLAEQFVSDVALLQDELVADLYATLEPMLVPARAEEARRVMAVSARRAAEAVLSRRADAMTAASAGLEAAAGTAARDERGAA